MIFRLVSNLISNLTMFFAISLFVKQVTKKMFFTRLVT